MKRIIKASLVLSFGILAMSHAQTKDGSLNGEIQKYNKIFNKINEKRYGLKEESINKTKNPFVVVYETKDVNKSSASGKDMILKKKEPVYVLNAIFEDRVKINKKWYKKNDIIGDYKVHKIKNYTVTLVSSEKTLKLKLSRKGKDNVKISTK